MPWHWPFATGPSTILHNPVVVENRGGASGLIAGRQVVNAEPDGYTVLSPESTVVIAQLMNAAPGLAIERDLQAVASVAPQANIVGSRADLPVSSLQELIALARTRKLHYASPGIVGAPN